MHRDTPRTQDEDVVREQERAAAAEAARIGGRTGEPPRDPAEEPLLQAGEGYAEGFEQAEEMLVEHAEQGDRPEVADFPPEPESDRASAAYGEPDSIGHAEMTEREQDHRVDAGLRAESEEPPGHHPDPDPDELPGDVPAPQGDPADEPPGHDPDPDPDELRRAG
jgi:hypothetical protein